jgi:hypothetical protein
MQTDLLITNMNSGQIYKARISSLACEQSVINMVNEHRCLLLEARRRKLNDIERQRMEHLNELLLSDFLEDFEEVGVINSPFEEFSENTTQLYF